ncbi:MAG: hypothetical protein IID16_09950 [Candidatus Marinimicrobia bacterium]|nr:hypothetical protein [Candidatus Neomarinimicrobiota bacterium]
MWVNQMDERAIKYNFPFSLSAGSFGKAIFGCVMVTEHAETRISIYASRSESVPKIL